MYKICGLQKKKNVKWQHFNLLAGLPGGHFIMFSSPEVEGTLSCFIYHGGKGDLQSTSAAVIIKPDCYI